MSLFKLWFVALLTSCVITSPMLAHAQALPVPTTMVGTGSGGRLVTGAITSVGSAAISANSGGAVAIGEAVSFKVGQAANASAFTATRSIPWKAISKAAAKSLPFISTGVALATLWNELRCTASSAGIQCDPGEPAPPPTQVVEYEARGFYQPGPSGAWASSIGQSCALVGQYNSGAQTTIECEVEGAGPWYRYHVRRTSDGVLINTTGWTRDYSTRNVDKPSTCTSGPIGLDGRCASGVSQPVTEQQAADKFEAYAPKSSAEQTLRDVLGTGQGHDFAPDAEPAALTGPATVPGPVKTTITQPSPDAPPQTVTETTTYNINYSGDVFSYTTNVVTHNHTTGETTTETTDPTEVAPPLDPSMPSVPELYERKYPDGLQGVWDAQSHALQQTPIFAFLQSLVPNTGDGGCPSWQMPVMYGIKNVGTAELSVPCWVWSALRAVFIVSALLASRKIVFGG